MLYRYFQFTSWKFDVSRKNSIFIYHIFSMIFARKIAQIIIILMSFIFVHEENLITLIDLKRKSYKTSNQQKCEPCNASTFHWIAECFYFFLSKIVSNYHKTWPTRNNWPKAKIIQITYNIVLSAIMVQRNKLNLIISFLLVNIDGMFLRYLFSRQVFCFFVVCVEARQMKCCHMAFSLFIFYSMHKK